MSVCITISGFHGTFTLGSCTMLGDPLVHPAWQVPGHVYESLVGGTDGFKADPNPPGTKETDGACVKVDSDRGKGAWLGDHGYSVDELVIDDYTMIFDSKETAYIRLSGAELVTIQNGFNFRATPFGPYIALRQDPQPGARENGVVRITAAGTSAGDLYKYGDNNNPTEGWNPCSLPVANTGCAGAPSATGQEWRIWYNNAKIGTGQAGTPTIPSIFPDGYKQPTFDDFQLGKWFSNLV
jgi:hypothetical protein